MICMVRFWCGRYPALPQPRQLSAFDPEWEEDPQFVAEVRKGAMLQATSKKLPSPAVLRDILSELTERQRSEERVRAPASCSASPGIEAVPDS